MKKQTIVKVAMFAAAIFAVGVTMSAKADRTIDSSSPGVADGVYKLVANEDWTADGAITLDGVAIDLNGFELKVKSISSGYIIDSSNNAMADYWEVGYLQSTSTGKQYIDTGYTHNGTTFAAIKILFPAKPSTTGTWYPYFGGGQRDQAYSFGGWHYYHTDGNWRHWKSVGNTNGSSEGRFLDISANTVYNVHLDKQSTCWIANEANDTVLASWKGNGVTWTSGVTPVSAYLFSHQMLGGGKMSAYHPCRIYSARIQTARNNGTIVRNFVPMKRLADNKPGMYDKANDRFYTNANAESSEDFTMGSLVDATKASDADAAVAGRLVLDVDDGTTLNTSAVSPLYGKIKLVKEGAGTLNADTKLYISCGIVVSNGTLKAGTTADNKPFGADGTKIEIARNATLDFNAKPNWGVRSYRFILSGGTITTSADPGNDADTAKGWIASLALEDDSTINMGGYKFGLVNNGYNELPLALNGHTLTINSTKAFSFINVRATSAGVINCGMAIAFFPIRNSDLSLATLDVQPGCNVRISSGISVTAGTYICNTAAADAVPDTGTLTVTNRFKPNTDYFHGCTLSAGATIDLSGRATMLPYRSLQTYDASNLQKTDISFTTGAFTVYTGTRSDALIAVQI